MRSPAGPRVLDGWGAETSRTRPPPEVAPRQPRLTRNCDKYFAFSNYFKLFSMDHNDRLRIDTNAKEFGVSGDHRFQIMFPVSALPKGRLTSLPDCNMARPAAASLLQARIPKNSPSRINAKPVVTRDGPIRGTRANRIHPYWEEVIVDLHQCAVLQDQHRGRTRGQACPR